MRSVPSLGNLSKFALETVPTFAWLNTGRSRPRCAAAFAFKLFFFPSERQCCTMSCVVRNALSIVKIFITKEIITEGQKYELY